MARRLLTLIWVVILALPLLATGAWCQSSRARLLGTLTQLPNAQLSPKVDAALSDTNADTKLLGLDLIIYRWATRASGSTPDVKNIDAIIKVIARQSSDPTLQWAQTIFPSNGETVASGLGAPKGVTNDTLILNLLNKLSETLKNKDARPVDDINSLKMVLESCLELRLELTYAQALSELGDRYFYGTTQFRDAANCYADAIWLFGTAYKCTTASAYLLDSSGLLNTTLGDYEDAALNHEQAGKQWLHLAEQDPSGYRYRDQAGLQYIKAGKAYMSDGQPDKGLRMMTEQGLAQLQIWAYSVKKYENLISNRMSIAELCRDKGRTTNAIGQLKAAFEDCKAYGDPLLKARICRELARTYSAAENEAEAAENTKLARVILDATAVAGDSAVQKLKRNLSISESLRNDYLLKARRGAAAHRELDNLSSAFNVWQELTVIYERLGLAEDRVYAMRALASIYEELQGEENQKKAQTLRGEAAIAAYKAGKVNLSAEIIEDIVRTYKEMGKLQSAIEGFAFLAPIVATSGDKRQAAQIAETIGDLIIIDLPNARPDMVAEKRLSAIGYFRNARTQYLDVVGDSWAYAAVSLKLAAALVTDDKPDEAKSVLETARRNIENLTPSADPTHSDILRSLYRDLAKLDIIAGKPDEAEVLLKRAVRYIWQPDLIKEMKTSEDPALAQFATLFASNVALIGENNPAILGPNESKRQMLLADTWGTFPDVCWVLRSARAGTAYNALPVNPLDIYATRTKLPSEAAIVTYLFTDSSAYALVCTRDRAFCWKLACSTRDVTTSVSELWAEIRACEGHLRSGIPIPPVDNLDNPSVAKMRKALAQLYSNLLTPIKEAITGKRLLTFVLPNELAGVPMHALVKEQAGSAPRYVIQDYEVSYLSEGMLGNFITRETGAINPTSDKLIMLADPDGNLPGAREEAKSIKDAYPNGKSFVGDEATVARLISEGKTAGLLHLAAHQRINPNSGTGFTLLLAHDDASDDRSGGNLSLQALTDFHNEKLKMVVLSACDSLASSDQATYGASRAAEIFTYVGARSVMGALWEASDQATPTLMTDFYRQINGRSTKSKSLRYAQTRMIESKDFAHPFYWACFALHGNPW